LGFGGVDRYAWICTEVLDYVVTGCGLFSSSFTQHHSIIYELTLWGKWVDTTNMETSKITIIDMGFDAVTKTFCHDEKKKGE